MSNNNLTLFSGVLKYMFYNAAQKNKSQKKFLVLLSCWKINQYNINKAIVVVFLRNDLINFTKEFKTITINAIG